MAKIPQNTSELSIKSTGLPEMPLGPVKASERAQAGVVEGLQGAEKAQLDIQDAFLKVRDFRQKTEAHNYTFERLNEVKSLADSDTDFDSAKYDTEIDKIGQDAAKTITGQLARDEFMADFTRQATATKWGIKNDFRVKELKSLDVSIDYQGQQIVDNYGGMNEADRITNVANYRKALENGVAIGLYNKGTADSKYAEFQKKVFKGQVAYDIYNDNATQEDNSMVLAELRKGKEGNYDFLDANTRLELIKDSQARIFQNNQRFERQDVVNTLNNRMDVLTKIANGTLDFKTADEAISYARSIKDIALADAIASVYKSKKSYLPIDINNDAFIPVAKNIFNAKSQKEVSDALVEALSKKEGINADRLAILIDAARQKAKTLPILKNTKDDVSITDSVWHGIQSGWDTISEIFNPITAAQFYADYLKNALSGMHPQEAVKKTQANYLIKRFPQIANYPNGMKFIDPASKKIYIAYPDGNITEENNPQGEK